MAREIATYQDGVERLLDELDIEPTERNKRACRSVLVDALKAIASMTRWSWYDRDQIIQTVAPYTTGTIAYDHTGGTYERMVTLTTGTWPSWADRGRLVISSVPYDIERRVSDTVITLSENINPGSDVASGTSYSLRRNSYDLPDDFLRLRHAADLTSNQPISINCPPDMLDQAWRSLGNSSQQPYLATIRQIGGTFGRMSLDFVSPTDAVYSIRLFYGALPRQLKTHVENTGTVTVSSGSTSVTGSGTGFTSDHVGCVFRLSSNTIKDPTNHEGHKTDNLRNPYSHQAKIVAVTSTTAAVLDEAPSSTHTAVKYTISDPIDVAQDAMLPALYKIAIRMLAVRFKFTQAAIQLWEAEERKAIIRAKESDQRTSEGDRSVFAVRPTIVTP